MFIWLIVRMTTMTVAAIVFLYEQSTKLKFSDAGHRQFEGFPYDPGQSIPGVFGRVFVAPWYNYDAVYYVRIVSSGYQAGDITSGFHPLYPWIARSVALLIREPLVSLMLVSSITGLSLSIAFYHLARLDCDHKAAMRATALLFCWPAALAIFLPYTEALFLLLAVCCMFAARRRHFWLAGLAGGLATLTRQPGLLLILPLAWEMWEAIGRDWRKLVGAWRTFGAITLVPAGYVAWIAYRAVAINDLRPDFSSFQNFIFSVVVSRTAHTIYQEVYFTWPWKALWKAAEALLSQGSHWTAFGDLAIAAGFIALLVVSWRKLRTSYRIYSVVVVIIALSLHTGPVSPYISLPRHLLPAFPVFIGIAADHKYLKSAFALVTLGICQALLLCCYVLEIWVP